MTTGEVAGAAIKAAEFPHAVEGATAIDRATTIESPPAVEPTSTIKATGAAPCAAIKAARHTRHAAATHVRPTEAAHVTAATHAPHVAATAAVGQSESGDEEGGSENGENCATVGGNIHLVGLREKIVWAKSD